MKRQFQITAVLVLITALLITILANTSTVFATPSAQATATSEVTATGTITPTETLMATGTAIATTAPTETATTAATQTETTVATETTSATDTTTEEATETATGAATETATTAATETATGAATETPTTAATATVTAGTTPTVTLDNDCSQVPTYAELKAALTTARNAGNGGFNFDMWGTIVNRDGVVCAVAFTGDDRGAQWPGSRVISAQKANTANAFSLPNFALSTANLWAPVQPGGSLYGLQASNPVDIVAAYKGPSSQYGTENDPLVGSKIGGVNVFGGGLALYNAQHVLVGAIGVSGDTSCADHNIAWRARHSLNMDFVTAGVGPAGLLDNINYVGLVPDPSLQADFSHPICKIAGVDNVSAISAGLPPTQ